MSTALQNWASVICGLLIVVGVIVWVVLAHPPQDPEVWDDGHLKSEKDQYTSPDPSNPGNPFVQQVWSPGGRTTIDNASFTVPPKPLLRWVLCGVNGEGIEWGQERGWNNVARDIGEAIRQDPGPFIHDGSVASPSYKVYIVRLAEEDA